MGQRFDEKPQRWWAAAAYFFPEQPRSGKAVMDARTPYNEIPLRGNTIAARLLGDDTAVADGVTVRSSSPVLVLCRKLVEAGHDPQSPLMAWRGRVLCLRVRSIGEAVGLRVNGAGTGFVPLREPTAGPPISANGNSDPEPGDGGAP
jgi:hypothetical protein